jgi:microcystin-dependent protein
MNLIGAGSEYQLNGTSITVSNPVSETGDNDFIATNTFAGTTDFNGPVNINDISSVTDIMSFDPNCLQLVNDAIPSNIGSIFLGSGGNLNLKINQTTSAIGINCGDYNVPLKADSSGLNVGTGIVANGNISANNLTATSAITGNTLTLTGASSVPTAPVGTNTNQIASTAFVLANAGGTGGGLNPNVPNTFTATQTFQGNTTYPTQLVLTKGDKQASILYDGLNLKSTCAGLFTFNDGTNASYFYPSPNNNLTLGELGDIITETSLNTALIPYLLTSTASQTYANLSGAVFSGNISCSNLSATSGSVAGSAILTQSSITPYLSNYAQISGQTFSGQISAPTIRSSGAISALSGTINGFPIVTKNNLDNALTGYAALTGATFTGNVTVPNLAINDKYPTTFAVTSDSVINYVNAKLVSANYFVGQIISGAFPTNYAPLINSGWLYCDGSVYDRFAYSDLFDVLGFNYPYSNPPNNTFAIPNFVGKTQLGGNADQAGLPTFSDDSTNVTYTDFYGGSIGITEAPQHNHVVSDNGHSHQYGSNFVNVNQGSGGNQQSALLNTPSVFANTTQPSYTGITILNNNTIPTVGTLPPYCVVNYFIYAGPNTP